MCCLPDKLCLYISPIYDDYPLTYFYVEGTEPNSNNRFLCLPHSLEIDSVNSVSHSKYSWRTNILCQTVPGAQESKAFLPSFIQYLCLKCLETGEMWSVKQAKFFPPGTHSHKGTRCVKKLGWRWTNLLIFVRILDSFSFHKRTLTLFFTWLSFWVYALVLAVQKREWLHLSEYNEGGNIELCLLLLFPNA